MNTNTPLETDLSGGWIDDWALLTAPKYVVINRIKFLEKAIRQHRTCLAKKDLVSTEDETLYKCLKWHP